MDENARSNRVGPAPPPPGTRAVRASDAEREETASAIRHAAAEGRLTMEELDERLASVYEARMRHELEPLVADLPAPPAPKPAPVRYPLTPGDQLALGVHLVLVLVLVVAVLTRWLASGMVFFWPIFPIFWAVVTLAVHARLRGVWPGWPPYRARPPAGSSPS
ncbi:MAG: DUF1707 domain-containing protein [Pseudonocardia sp.]|nr:DUF1707 domain-containing protein [Pseudonocardia sp.]